MDTRLPLATALVATILAAVPLAAQVVPTDSLRAMRRTTTAVPVGGTVAGASVGLALAPESATGWGLSASLSVGRVIAPFLQLRGELSAVAFTVAQDAILCPPEPTDCRPGRSGHPGYVLGVGASAVVADRGRTPLHALAGVGGAVAERTARDGSVGRVLWYGGVGVSGPGVLRRLSLELRHVQLVGGGEPRHRYWPLALGVAF